MEYPASQPVKKKLSTISQESRESSTLANQTNSEECKYFSKLTKKAKNNFTDYENSTKSPFSGFTAYKENIQYLQTPFPNLAHETDKRKKTGENKEKEKIVKVEQNEQNGTPEFGGNKESEGNVRESMKKLIENFKEDNTFYELTDKSDDTNEDDDANYDSRFFSEIENSENSEADENQENLRRSKSAEKNFVRIVTLQHKMIAKWAENKENIKKIIRYQNDNIDADQIFGKMNSAEFTLSQIFGYRKRYEQRGSSANWKNEYWTPDEQQCKKRLFKGNAENLGGCAFNKKLEENGKIDLLGALEIPDDSSFDHAELLFIFLLTF